MSSSIKPQAIYDALIAYGMTPDDAEGVVLTLTGGEDNEGTALDTVVSHDSPINQSPSHSPHATVETPKSVWERYEDLGVLGTGGMGEVRRLRDRVLGRTVAMKIIRPEAAAHREHSSRFVEETQATAQLQHPGIVPVYDMGQLEDGRHWFTMKEVAGQTLSELISGVHEASANQWEVTPEGWSLRMMLDVFRRVCETVAYAHGRGVIHRDLKPSNIMVGAHGEVLIVDWGLAKVMGQPESHASAPGYTISSRDSVQTERSASDTHATQMGRVVGTPAYMSPEQASGKIDVVDARSDVYSLGAVLYKILSGRSPYTGQTGKSIIKKVRQGPPASLRPAKASGVFRTLIAHGAPQSSQSPSIPVELLDAVERAMARNPTDRFQTASELATEIAAWLEGSRKKEVARQFVSDALSRSPQARALLDDARRLSVEAATRLDAVEPWRDEAHKVDAWHLQDLANEKEKAASILELEAELLLHGSLTHAPDLQEAHLALSELYSEQHKVAELSHQDTQRAEFMLQQHVAALSDDDPKRAKYLNYLIGDGLLSVQCDPVDAEVTLYRFEAQPRRLVPVLERALGRTPIHRHSLKTGSYLCVLEAPGFLPVNYPVFIERQMHWDGVPPDGIQTQAIHLPPVGSIRDDEVYIPAGWYRSGGEPNQPRTLPNRRIWLDALVMKRHPVSNRDYLAFLDSLVASGQTELALRCAPRERTGKSEDGVASVYAFDGDRFSLQPDADGDLWDLDWPVMLVNWFHAKTYAEWYAQTTGEAWRLPGELEWEKAARGVDGRRFPWGNFPDPSYACVHQSQADRHLLARIDQFPLDISPYGVRHLAGNVNEWCIDGWSKDGPEVVMGRATRPGRGPATLERPTRGGHWLADVDRQLVACRHSVFAQYRESTIGFRICRPYLSEGAG